MDAVTKPDNMAEDSDDEDLEALRLAALQSIKSKPTVIAPRRRPKPISRPFRKRRGNFHQGRVNTNLIAIVPLELPLDQAEPSKQSDPPPPLVLPQDRYCKTEVKEKQEEKKISVPSKFSRFEDSNSGDSDDDYEEDFLNQSSESDKPGEGSDKNNKVDNESILDDDDDELLLQDEDSLGKFFNEFESEQNEDEPSRKSSHLNKDSQNAKPSDRQDKNKPLDSGSTKGGEKANGKSLSVKDSEGKSALDEKKSNESQLSRLSKGDKSKDYMHDRSPLKEDDRRINRPCVYGRNRSPSPLSRGRFDKYQQLPKRGGRNSPIKRKISPSTESLSPVGRREPYQHKNQLPPAKSLHSSHHPSVGSSPHEVTPPHWGSRSDSNHGMGVSLSVSREWSSSPHKWPASNAPGTSVNSPNKSISPSRQRRRSRSPLHKGTSRTWERDWSGSPQQKRSRDFDTPPGSQRSTGDSSKAVKRRSSSPISDRRDRSRSGHSKDRSHSPRGASPLKQYSPSKLPRRVSPVRSSSRTPSLSPSPEPQGKSSSRRYKSPLRISGFRPPNHRDNRIFRPDGKPNRKDSDRRAGRLNGPPRKGPESKVELTKMRPYNARLEVKVTESSPPKKSEVERDVIPARSPNKGTVTNSWSSDECQSDSESRFKGTESKVVKPAVISSKIMPAVPRAKEPEETSSSEIRSPKKKKNKRLKKSFSKVKGMEVEDTEPKEKQTNDGDLRAELSRRRAERVNKAKNATQTMPVRLVQSAFQSLTSKLNPVDGERNKSRLPANCPLPRASDCDKEEASSLNVDGGNKRRKIKLKRNVTVQKSMSRGTTSPVTNTSGVSLA
ncbi:hypothetical protein J437_LFUL000364 [Ladona fulva]|uniref:Uncharacterized protein n=1 Tax=Ladona fulva TaxID=123851 RepID=A0A8K0JZL3_LADFU|nr:hypothetical protein J437_LFUL000364 [Ladona fulva]